MRTKATITARDSTRVVKVTITSQSAPRQYTRDEHKRFRNKLVDGIHAALVQDFFAAQIKIK